jgi:hypothetical protein
MTSLLEKILNPEYEKFDRSEYDNELFIRQDDENDKIYSNVIIDIDFKNKINLKKNDNYLDYQIIIKDKPELCNNTTTLQINKPNKILNYDIIKNNTVSIYDYPKLRNDFKYFYLFIITQIDRVTFNLYLSIVNYIHYDIIYEISDFIKVFKKLYKYLYIVKKFIDDKPDCKKELNILNKQTKVINLINNLEHNLEKQLKL